MTNGHRRIFAGTELAARIERAERSLIAESALAAGRRDPAGAASLPRSPAVSRRVRAMRRHDVTA